MKKVSIFFVVFFFNVLGDEIFWINSIKCQEELVDKFKIIYNVGVDYDYFDIYKIDVIVGRNYGFFFFIDIFVLVLNEVVI